MKQPKVSHKDQALPLSKRGMELERELAVVVERAERLKVFLNTRLGQIVSSLVQPEIDALTARVSRPIEECLAQGLPLEAVHEMRAELRGQLFVWARLRDEPLALENRAKEIRVALEDVEEKAQAVRKTLEKYA